MSTRGAAGSIDVHVSEAQVRLDGAAHGPDLTGEFACWPANVIVAATVMALLLGMLAATTVTTSLRPPDVYVHQETGGPGCRTTVIDDFAPI